MPTVGARLDVALAGVDVTAQVNVQIAQLDDLRVLIEAGTPGAVTLLERLVSELAAPDLPIVGDLGVALSAALGALPDDPPADDLDTVLGTLATAAGTQLSGLVSPLVEAGNALVALAQADLACAAEPPPDSIGDGGPGGAPGGGPGEPQEPAPPQGAATAAAVASALDLVLSDVPEPLDVAGLLTWVLERVDVPFRLPFPLPSVGDLAEPIKTVITLAEADAAGIRDHIAATLTAIADLVATIPGEVAGVTDDLGTAAAAVPVDLAALADGIAAGLNDLAAAAAAGDAAATQDAVATLEGIAGTFENRVTALRAAVLDGAVALVADVAGLADALDDRAALVAYTLTPAGVAGPILAQLREALTSDATADAIAAVVAEIDTYVAWLQDLVRVLDVAAITEPLEQAGDAVAAAVADVQEALAGIGAGVATALDAVVTPLEAFDAATVAADARAQLEGFLADLAEEVSAAFEPVETALNDVVNRVTEAAQAFDPASLTGVVDDAVDAVTGVLSDPAVAGTVDAVAGALETATAQLETAEFTPVTDAVVAAIEEVDSLLAGLDTSALPTPASIALTAALSLLPDDPTPVTDALLADLDDLIAAGPLDLIERIRAIPADLRARIETFDPATLIDQQLGPVFDEVRAGLDVFAPTAILALVDQALAGMPAMLEPALDAGALLAPLDGPVATLRASLAALDPATLAAPLVDGLAGIVAQVRDELGVDAVGAAIGDIHVRITDTVAALGTVRDVAERLVTILAALAAVEGDVDAWLDGLFPPTITDDGSIAAAADAVAAAVAEAGETALVAGAGAAASALTSAIEAADPAGRLAAIVTAHRGVVRTQIESLPGPVRTAALAILGRLDPFDGVVADGLQGLAALGEGVTEATAATVAALADWDTRNLAPTGPLRQATTIDASPAALLQELRDATRASVADPLHAVLAVAGPVGAIISALLEPLRALLTDVEARLATLASVSGALDGVAGVVDDALDQLAQPDLGVLTDALDEAVDRAVAALDSVSPAALGAALDTAVNQVLVAFDPVALVPSLATLTAAFDQALAELSALDPAVVLGDALGDAFNERVTPLLDRLDVSPLLDLAAARLAVLPAELDAELARVNEAYRRLLDHVSDLDLSIDIDIDIDIGIDLPIPSPF